MKKSPSKKAKKITLEGTAKIFDMIHYTDPNDWKIGNIGYILYDNGYFYTHHYLFLVGENKNPIFFVNTVPLSFTEKTTNASSFYASYEVEINPDNDDNPRKTKDDSFYESFQDVLKYHFSVEIGSEDDWVIENYGKGLPKNMHFKMQSGQLKKTIFHLNPSESYFGTPKPKKYSLKRTLSYEEIMILGRYFKDPSKGYSYQFIFTYPFSKENKYVHEMHADETISSNLPKGWVMGIYKIFKEKNKIKGIVDYFGSKVNQKKAFSVIESMYQDVEDLSFRENWLS